MPASDIDQKKALLQQELRIQRQLAFASGLFQGDITIRTLLESVAEGVVIIDNSGTIMLVNKQAEQMFGYSAKELIGKPHLVLIPEHLRKVHEEHEADFFKEPRTRSMGQLLELAGRRRDGREFPLEISLGFIETINGVFVLAFVSDITLRKQYEAYLRETEELFRIQVECVKDYAIFMLDAEGNVLNWNVGAERLKGYRDEEIIGKHFSCFYPEEDRDAGKPTDELKKAAAEGQGEDEGWRIRKDGSRFWAEVITTALRNENGNLRGFSKVTRDITERKRAEEALRESEERSRAIFEHAAVGIGEVSPDGRFLRVNRKLCEIVGYTEEELKALSHREITHPHDLEDSLKHFQLLLEGKLGNYFLVKRYIRKDGSIVWVNLTVSAVSDAGGNLKFTVGVVEDITERKQAEEKIERMNAELEAANRELEAFNYTVAHDLRNPLNVICSYCQVFKELCGDQLREECMGYVQETYNGALRMNRLIEALLNFSRMGHAELRREMLDLSGMAQVVAAELKLTKHERQVDFRITDGIAANADANMLQVVLNNLLGNAWKYTGKREEALIEFGATEIDGQPVYFVRDNGAGFDKANADKLFAPFQRLPGAEEFRGSGIGLATVERIIRRHGGKIWAEGEPDKGATFYFTL